MGCSSSSDYEPTVEITISEEEKYFNREDLLKYRNVLVEDIFAASVSYSTLQNKFTKPKLKQLMATVGLESVGLETTDSPLRHFYMKLMKGEYYESRKVKLLGILLSKGSPSTKAKLVFNEFDGNGSKTLDLQEVTSMVDTLCTLALVLLPAFSIEVAKDAKKKTELPVMQAYADKLKRLLPRTTTYLVGTIVSSGTISFSDFQNKFNSGDANVLCSAAILRSFAVDYEATTHNLDQDTENVETNTSTKRKPAK